MTTFDVGKLLNKIKDDIPGINAVLRALARWDVSTFTDVPEGAMQATTDANKRLTLKQLIAGTWAPITKLMHDVDTVDGYHASTSVTAGTIPVRDQHGALVGNITGNAATATEAEKLSAGAVVPVNQGGTGATTSSGARANLGAAAGADFEEHEALNGGSVVYGHVRLPELAANGTASAAPYGFGLGEVQGAQIPASVDLNTYDKPGFFSCRLGSTAATLINCPTTTQAFSMLVEYGAYGPSQTIKEFPTNGKWFYRTKHSSTVFSAWREIPSGISDAINGASRNYAASEYALSQLNSEIVRVSTSSQTIYISKAGNDANDGSTEAKAVLTPARALDIATGMRVSRNGTIIFRFGAGDWGNLDIRAGMFSCGYIQITSITTTIGSTGNTANLPKFSRIYGYTGRFYVSNVISDIIYAQEGAFLQVMNYIKTGCLEASGNSLVFISSGLCDVYKTARTQFFYAIGGGEIQARTDGTIFNFLEDCAFSASTANASYNGTIVFRTAYVTFTGVAQTGQNFAVAAGGAIYNYPSASKIFFPGNGTYIMNTGGSYCGETAELAAVNTVGSFAYSLESTKAGYLLCDGAAVSRVTYKSLFDAIGTKFGAGNGTTTFNIPNARGRVLQGAAGAGVVGDLLAAGLPNVTGTLPITMHGSGSPSLFSGGGSGALFNNYAAETQNSFGYSGTVVRSSDNFARLDASRSSSIYGNSSTVPPPAIALNVFIKY